ncbi:uncharacterized protein LOC131690190 isoform X2 [Topomyia yanbarensis]|uniref:uncharacterized protein LOC131690190 isoform X2 n=1 Tax=Topomyia yanbarensis TaxID=2498891 RepID=UPI00273AE61F|nr:uncharacterized protein LOC131690190 isoform X2 [Topomyia yanbarensis]
MDAMDVEIKNEPIIIDGYELVDHSSNISCKPSQSSGYEEVTHVSNETGFQNDEMLLLLQQWDLEILSDRFIQNLIDTYTEAQTSSEAPMKDGRKNEKPNKTYVEKTCDRTDINAPSQYVSQVKPDQNSKTITASPEYVSREPQLHRESLLEICKLDDMGRKFLEQYRIEDGKRIYSAESRKYIKNSIVEYFLRIGQGHISAQIFTKMVQIILDELPDEDPRIWYNPSINGMASGGLLYTRYRYLTQKDKRYRVQKGDPIVPHATSVLEQAERCWNELSESAQMECFAAKHKLMDAVNMHRVEIHDAWKNSFPIRRYEAVTKKLRLDEWVVLASFEEIHELIRYDFCSIHSIEHDCIKTRITQFVTQFINIYPGYKALIEEDKQLTSALLSLCRNNLKVDDKATFLAFYALPLILRMNFIGKHRKRSKPSLKSGRATFIVLLETEAGITETIAQRKRTASEEGTAELWPYIIAIGNTQSQTISGYFVVLESMIFKCNTVVEAVDLLFKIYTVFHLEYAYQCESVLKFIQQYFYNLIYDGTRQDTNVAAFITDLNRGLS